MSAHLAFLRTNYVLASLRALCAIFNFPECLLTNGTKVNLKMLKRWKMIAICSIVFGTTSAPLCNKAQISLQGTPMYFGKIHLVENLDRNVLSRSRDLCFNAFRPQATSYQGLMLGPQKVPRPHVHVRISKIPSTHDNVWII